MALLNDDLANENYSKAYAMSTVIENLFCEDLESIIASNVQYLECIIRGVKYE